MIYLGVDIAKKLHFAAAISSDGEILKEPFEFSNDHDGFLKLMSVIESFNDNNLIIGLESTAHYGHNLVYFLYNPNFKICVINPIQVAHTIEQVELLNRQLDELHLTIESIMISLDSVIMTVPGIGYLNGAMILGEIGDIHRFKQSKHLLAFAGLDPSVYQSGKFKASNTRMSNRGSRMLRYALMNAAHNVVRNNKTFHDYYELKRSQGRHHYNALGHCAGKLVRVLHKILTDDIPFNLD